MRSRKQGSPVTILIADDHAILRKGLKDLMNEEPGLEVIGEAANGQEAYDRIAALNPNVAILDIDMPVRSGLEVAAELKGRSETRLIALSMHDEEKIYDKAMDVGFLAFILKDGAISDIVAAIKAVMAGKYYISPALSTFAVARTMHTKRSETLDALLLTQTERKVLRLISENKSTKEIAETLFVSPRTIDSHRANIAQKLGLRGPNALLRWAMENKGKI